VSLAVPAAIGSIYGMSFKYMPELEWSFGYPAVLLLMLVICVSFITYSMG
jgi:magnesium transporter